MKLIDKHVLRQFAVPFAFCLLAFCMIFIVFDLFDHLSDFFDAQTPLPQIVRYYLYILPSLMVYVMPISLLLGLLYSLWQLSKHGELIAMRAGGISLWRATASLAAVGLAASLLVTALNESVAPWAAYWADQFIKRQKQGDELSTRYARNLTLKNETEHRIWYVDKFDLTTHDLETVKVVQQRPDGSDAETLTAETGKFYDGRWWLFGVAAQAHDHYNNPAGPIVRHAHRQMAEWPETPEDFLQEIKDPAFLSANDLRTFLRVRDKLSDKTQARYAVDLHARLAMPWTCLVVMLFGIPCGVRTARQGALAGVLTALLIFFAFYFLMTFGQWLGKEQFLTPLVSAWLPNLAFASAGLFMAARMR